MLKMKRQTLLVLVCVFSFYAQAQAESSTVSTQVSITVEDGKAAGLRSEANKLADMVQAGRYEEAEQRAAELRGKYEAKFDRKVKQYSFQSRAEYEEFLESAKTKFEWIDWGYIQCLQIQAYVAAQKKEFSSALEILQTIEEFAPVSAGSAAETGYVLNQLGKPNEALSAYRRAHKLAQKYVSQHPYRALALRGLGYTLIELKQIDEAEQMFLKSLEIEPGNEVALSELAYIRNLRGDK